MTDAFSPWQQRAWARIAGAHAADRLGHALLVCGPEALGKRALADALAALVLCREPADGHACGQCRACVLRIAGNHPDLRRVSLLERDDGKLKTEIGVEQMRELGAWFALTPQLGRAQVALIDPADALNTSSANALLKTLEEPAPGRYLVLVSARPLRLPATIRSRCQRIELKPPPADEASAWLAARTGRPGGELQQALQAADGHPGIAERYLQDGALALRDEIRRDLGAVREGKEAAGAVAQRWIGDRVEQRLRFAAEWVRDIGRSECSSGLTPSGDFPKLAAWFDQANRLREQLSAPLKHELLLVELLLGWRAVWVR